MNGTFPIPLAERLPVRLNPSTIVEASFEVRFVTSEPWTTLPGLLYALIRERYSEQRELPLARVPEEIRRQDPGLGHLPLIQFLSANFLVQFGPRAVTLGTRPNAYAGWSAIETELSWLLGQLQKAGFIKEAERLGVRYIDFFHQDILENLILKVFVHDQPLTGGELHVDTVLRNPPFTVRLQLTNSAILGQGSDAKRGSVLDLDVWLGPLDFDLFSNGLQKFSEARHLVKQIFFGLLTPDFVASSNPEYS